MNLTMNFVAEKFLSAIPSHNTLRQVLRYPAPEISGKYSTNRKTWSGSIPIRLAFRVAWRSPDVRSEFLNNKNKREITPLAQI